MASIRKYATLRESKLDYSGFTGIIGMNIDKHML
jgi:hypothetical protein